MPKTKPSAGERRRNELAHQIALKATRLRNRADLLESEPASKRYRNGVRATLKEMAALLANLEKDYPHES